MKQIQDNAAVIVTVLPSTAAVAQAHYESSQRAVQICASDIIVQGVTSQTVTRHLMYGNSAFCIIRMTKDFEERAFPNWQRFSQAVP